MQIDTMDGINDSLNMNGLNILGVEREPQRHLASYEHKDQLNFYGRRDEECSEFTKRYRFKKKTVETLALLLEEDIGPKGLQNNAFDAEKRLNIALRFYATGSFQGALGDGEGASQSSCSRFLSIVSKALSDRCDDMVRFCIDKSIMQTVSQGFYACARKFSTLNNVIGCYMWK